MCESLFYTLYTHNVPWLTLVETLTASHFTLRIYTHMQPASSALLIYYPISMVLQR